uniref:Retinoblastoma-associated protein A-box domain-containing protein n=1 Tax=Spongospora subterranea TaxID=70186 RepID=A0A0H5RQH4_9EUKA|eukprot:CRZ10959.1 hypothetical protein [Spongospora subterranea]
MVPMITIPMDDPTATASPEHGDCMSEVDTTIAWLQAQFNVSGRVIDRAYEWSKEAKRRGFIQQGYGSLIPYCALLEAIHFFGEHGQLHATSLLQFSKLRIVDFCKDMSVFIEEFGSHLTDQFLVEARAFVVGSIQLWVLYCKYESMFISRWSTSEDECVATLFACGWLLFLCLRAELSVTYTSKCSEDLYRLFTVLTAVIEKLASLRTPIRQAEMVPITDNISGISESLFNLVIQRLVDQGVWHDDDLVESAAELGRHIDMIICAKDAVPSCWLLDGRVVFSAQLKQNCGCRLDPELFPVTRSPIKATASTPVSLMMQSVSWLSSHSQLTGAKLSQLCIDVWPSFSETRLNDVLQAHKNRDFRYGSHDPSIIVHRCDLSIQLFFFLLDSLVRHELSLQSDADNRCDLSYWLDSRTFQTTLLYCSTQIVVGAYRINISSQEELISSFEISALECVSVMRNILASSVINDDQIRNHFFGLYQLFIIHYAWKDVPSLLSGTCSKKHSHFRVLVRAAHTLSMRSLQYISRSVMVDSIESRSMSIIKHIIKEYPVPLLSDVGLDVIIACSVFALAKLASNSSVQLVSTYQMICRYRSVFQHISGQKLIKFYNERFVPTLKPFLFSRDTSTHAVK